MNEYRYKAFISYSHKDEKWAAWLHRALESYRLPRQLVGRQTSMGPVPSRLSPVFRDREDFSSGVDLSNKVQEALADSAALIVLCSPAAAGSRWVNEEIRAFRRLGRGDRVFAVIVDGDIQAERLEDSCFPPALMESVAEKTVEPLAADVRKWADGKALAKLKLVSGMLGLRLDELRMRERKRRNRARVAWIVTVAAAFALALFAVISQVEKRAQREQSERFVSEMVEFSQGLNAQVDLETLRNFAMRVQEYLDGMEADDLTPESRKQVALVLRQLGMIGLAQGRLKEAMQAFARSRAIIEGLMEQQPEHLDYVYEMGNAEFYVASVCLEMLDYEAAKVAFSNYLALANELKEAEPNNPAWLMEVSSAHTNLAALGQRSGMVSPTGALEHMASAVEYTESAMKLAPDNAGYREKYVSTLSWLADAQMRVCNLADALATRRKNEAMARELRLASPANNKLKKDHAYALTGLAGLQRQAGLTDESAHSLDESRRLLAELLLVDPSNDKYRWEVLFTTALIAELRSDIGQINGALEEMQSVRKNLFEALSGGTGLNLRRQSEYAHFLLHYSDTARRSGDRGRASGLLDEAISRLQSVLEKNQSHRQSLENMGMAAFLWRQLHGRAGNEVLARHFAPLARNHGGVWSCDEANFTVRYAILEGNRSLATELTHYLLGKGFRDPEFLRFCNQEGLCD